MSETILSTEFNLTRWFFSRVADKNKTVFFTPKENMSYLQLEEKSKLAAASLMAYGILPAQRVIISLNDGVEIIMLFLACVAVGACPIVLNPRLGSDALSYVLKDSNATLMFFEFENVSIIQDVAKNIGTISTKAIDKFLSFGSINWNNYHNSNIEAISFIQYTSGTTGEPKAVLHSSQSVVASCELFAKAHLHIKSNDILYSIPKMFFGYGLGNTLFFTLYFGASSIVDFRWPTVNIILDNIKRFSPSIIFGVPDIYKKLYAQSLSWYQESNVRLFFSAGSPLPEKLQQVWGEKYKTKIYEGLGATEMCHVFITNDQKNFKCGSVGKVIKGYHVKIVDREDREVVSGQQGVLHVSGPSMALGYCNKDHATQLRFRNGWYCTGDIFSSDQDGFLYYHGREDELFKVNGRWIAPSRIESYVKSNFTQVHEAFLVPGEDDYQTKPVLFVTGFSSEDNELTDSIIQSIARNFESFQSPVFCTVLDELPRNDNGKVLRSILSKEASILLRTLTIC